MQTPIRGHLLYAALFTISLTSLGTGHVLAQGGASRMDVMLEEITVTARKREESLQDAPISITAYTGEQLELRGIDDLDRLQNITPNLTFIDSSTFIAGSNSATVFMLCPSS